MKLQLDFVDIKDIQFGEITCVRDNVLYINKREAEEHLLQDPKLFSASIDLAHPGEKTRIVFVHDVVEPRCKVDPEGADFPGHLSKIQAVGSGVTRVLRGTAVALCSEDSDRGYISLLDMDGPMAKISKYSRMPMVVLTVRRSTEAISYQESDAAFQKAAFRLAVYLAKAGKEHPVSETRVYDHDLLSLPQDSPLPRVGYYCLIYSPQYDHHGKSEPFFYGGELPNTLPSLVHPNEFLDGGVVGYFPMKGLDTYSIQNHGVISELYSRHGKDLLFAGVMLAVAHENPLARDRRAMVAAGIAKNTLHADGIILTKAHGGMMHMDLATVAEACERAGVRTVPFHQGVAAQGSLADHSLFKSPLLDAVVYLGVTVESCPLMSEPERFLGGPPDARRHSPTGAPRKSNDKDLTSEEYLLAGVHDHTGGAYVRSADY